MKNLKHEAYKIRLTQEEKTAMLSRVLGVPSPLSPAPSPYIFFNFQFARYVFAPLALLLVVGVGTVSAAGGALPGDLLYPIKVGVAERVERALAASPGVRAQVEVKLAERRIEEAEVLAARGALGEDAAAALSKRFDEHAANAVAFAASAKESEPAAAAEVSAALDSSFLAHGAVLSRLGKGSSDSNTRKNSAELAGKVSARSKAARVAAEAQVVATEARTSVQSTMSAMAPVERPVVSGIKPSETGEENKVRERLHDDAGELKIQSDALQVRERAEKRLKEARERFDAISGSLKADLAAQFEEQFDFAEESLGRGGVQLGGGAWAEAHTHFAEALKVALKLEVLLKAHKKFDSGLIAPLLPL